MHRRWRAVARAAVRRGRSATVLKHDGASRSHLLFRIPALHTVRTQL